MSYAVEYFNGHVLEEVESWPADILASYARLVELLMEFGPQLSMPHSRPMGGGLFELRARGKEGIGRALYCFVIDRRVVVLHVFIKKAQATPKHDLDLARARIKEAKDGEK